VIQNPQTQTAITRATLNIGDGTASYNNENGRLDLLPVATFLRSLIVSAQAAP